jgi:AcrR family transcriptional regulator
VELIFSAALKVALRTGYAGLTMADVAKQAGIATGTVYIYFKNKSALINQLYLHPKQAKTRAMMTAYQADADFLTNFESLWRSYMELSLEDPERMMFLEQYVRSPYLTPAVRKKSEQLLAPLAELLAAGQAAGQVRKTAPDILISALMGSANEIVKYHLDRKERPSRKTLDECYARSDRRNAPGKARSDHSGVFHGRPHHLPVVQHLPCDKVGGRGLQRVAAI